MCEVFHCHFGYRTTSCTPNPGHVIMHPLPTTHQSLVVCPHLWQVAQNPAMTQKGAISLVPQSLSRTDHVGGHETLILDEFWCSSCLHCWNLDRTDTQTQQTLQRDGAKDVRAGLPSSARPRLTNLDLRHLLFLSLNTNPSAHIGCLLGKISGALFEK